MKALLTAILAISLVPFASFAEDMKQDEHHKDGKHHQHHKGEHHHDKDGHEDHKEEAKK